MIGRFLLWCGAAAAGGAGLTGSAVSTALENEGVPFGAGQGRWDTGEEHPRCWPLPPDAAVVTATEELKAAGG